MKIAYYTEVNLKDNDGPAVNEMEFIKSLSTLPKEQYIIFCKENNVVSNEISHVVLTSSPRISEFGKWISRFRLINRVIKERKIDILVCRLPDFPLIPLLLKIFNPQLKLAIKTAALWWVGREKARNIKDKIYNYLNDFFTKRVYKLADAIDVAMLETMKTLLDLRLANKLNVFQVDNAINIDMFIPKLPFEARNQLGIPKEAIVLGFAGSLPSQRGVSQMLRVAESLQDSFPNLFLLIIGHDQKMQELINGSRYPKEKIMTPGIVPYEQVPYYLSAMTICYSFFEQNKIEKTGNASQKVKQYIAMGKPVISVGVGHEYLKHYSLGSPVDQGNIQEITSETINWIRRIDLEGDSVSTRLHQYAIENFSTQHTFNQRLNFWQKL